MDYIFLSTVKDKKVKMIKVSYDIACRWSINLFRRIEEYPRELRISKDRFSLEYFIPKFHLPAHGPSFHTLYSFNHRPGVGRTHGENIESGWAHVNPTAVATREMGAGARHSALDSHWGGWNWRKIVGLGKYCSIVSTFNHKICRQEHFFSEISTKRGKWHNNVRPFARISSATQMRGQSRSGMR